MVRRLARPMLAGVFIFGGLDTLRNPEPRVAKAEKLGLDDADRLTRLDAAAKVAAGTLLAAGRLPRLSALVLAASLVPTTLAGHRFWEESDPAVRGNQRIHFLKNLSMLGGLLVAAADTGGRASMPHRARKALPGAH